jgi:hypothetical protein
VVLASRHDIVPDVVVEVQEILLCGGIDVARVVLEKPHESGDIVVVGIV